MMCLPWNHDYEIKENVHQLSTVEILKGQKCEVSASLIRPATLTTVVQCRKCSKVKHTQSEL